MSPSSTIYTPSLPFSSGSSSPAGCPSSGASPGVTAVTGALAAWVSGSVEAELLSRFCTELSGLLSDFDATLFVLYHDVRVNACAVYTRADMPFTPVPVGGGGTDYRPVPERLEEEGMLPSCLLWFTDLECDRFPEEPPYPVLWIVPEQPRVLPPFGETVVMPPAGIPA